MPGRDGTPGERVLHLFATSEQIELARARAVAVLTDAGWRGSGCERYVAALEWRCLTVPALVEHYRDQVSSTRSLVGYVRAALPGGTNDRDQWDDHELADLVLGEGRHTPATELTESEHACQRALIAWANTGTDVHADGTVQRLGGRVDELAAQRATSRLDVVADNATVAALLRGQDDASATTPPEVPSPGSEPATPSDAPSSGVPGSPSRPGPTGTPTADVAGGVAEPEPDAWAAQAALLLDSPGQPETLRDAWHQTDEPDEPDRRRLLVLIALDVLAGHDPDEHLLAVAVRGFGPQVTALVRADDRWRRLGQ